MPVHNLVDLEYMCGASNFPSCANCFVNLGIDKTDLSSRMQKYIDSISLKVLLCVAISL